MNPICHGLCYKYEFNIGKKSIPTASTYCSGCEYYCNNLGLLKCPCCKGTFRIRRLHMNPKKRELEIGFRY